MAQLVERHLAKVETAGSSPVYRFFYCLIYSGSPGDKGFRFAYRGRLRREGTFSSCLSMGLSPVPGSGGLSFGSRTAEKQSAEGFPVEGKQGPEIAEAPEGRSGGR